MLFCKCLEIMSQQSNNHQNQQCDKKYKIKQNIKTDKKSVADEKECEDSKVTNLSSIKFILKELTDGNDILDNLQDSCLDNCPICHITKEAYKADVRYVSLLEKIINSVIQKEVTELLEGAHEDDKSSPLQQTQNSTMCSQNKKEENQKSTVSNPEQHSLRCLLIHLQRVLGELILQICFSLSCKSKSEKLNRLSKLNMTDMTLLELRTLNYQFSALTDHIIYTFKDSKNVDGSINTPKTEKSNKQVVRLKQKVNNSINTINSTLNSVKKIHIQQYQNKPVSKTTDGKCCNRMYPHVHCNMNGNNFIMKYVKSKGNKNVADQLQFDGKSKYSNGRDSMTPTEDSSAVKSHTLPITNSLSALSMHVLHDKLLTIIKDSAELQKKVNETLKNKMKVKENEDFGKSDIIKHSDGKDKSSQVNIITPRVARYISRKELENAIDDIIVDACNKYYSRTEGKYTRKDLKKNLTDGVDDSKATLVKKQTDYLVNHAHLSPGLFSNLSKDNNGNTKYKTSDVTSATELIQGSKPSQSNMSEPDVSIIREYLPYSVSIESLPLSPEEIEELSSQIGKDVTKTAENYRHENLPTNGNNIFSMNIRRLADLINDDKCEHSPHVSVNHNSVPYSPSLTSLPLTNEELEEIFVRLNKNTCINKDQGNNNTEMQVMYFETDVNPNFIFKNRRSLSCIKNVKTKRSTNIVINRMLEVTNKKPKDSDKISLKMANNLSYSITPPLKTNRIYQAKGNKSIEEYKDTSSKFSDVGDTKQFTNTIQKELFTVKKNTDLEIMNAKIKCSNHNLYKLRIRNKRLSSHKDICATETDNHTEVKQFKNMSKENNTVKQFFNKDMKIRPVGNVVNRLSTKSININKSKHKINANENVFRKRQQMVRINTNMVKNKNTVKKQDDKYRMRRHVRIHYSSITFHYATLKVISLNQQNCFVMHKREIKIVLYKPLLKIGYKQENYLKLNCIVSSKTVYHKGIKQHNFNTIPFVPIDFYIPRVTVLRHVKIIHMVKYAEFNNNLYFNVEKEEMLLADLKVKIKRPVINCIKKKSFKNISKTFQKKSARMKNWCGDTSNLGQYSFSELDVTVVDSKLCHYMYSLMDECLSILNNNVKCKKKYEKNALFKNINTQESAQEFLNHITRFLKSSISTTVSKKQVLSQVFDTFNSISDKENTCVIRDQLEKRNDVPIISIRPASFQDIHKEPLYLFDILGRPLTDSSGHVLKSRKGELLLKYSDSGKPISDVYGGPVFDATGLKPSEYEFNATRTPYNVKSAPLVNAKHDPLKIYDCNGRPLTSADGIPLANSAGEIMLKFDSQGRPISDILGKPIYISNHS